jgi:hypothetical protein
MLDKIMASADKKNKREKRLIPLRAPGETVYKQENRPSKLLFDEVSRQMLLEENPDLAQTRPRPDPDQTQTDSNIKIEPNENIVKTSDEIRLKTEFPLAPVRDFNKRANSIDRDAMPLGVFPGASKKIYDSLYIRTRGAINPVRNIQATRRELMTWSGIQNIKTINAHLKRLKDAGFLKITNFVGEQSGSIYEVFLPEELRVESSLSSTQTRPRPDPDQTQKMDSDQTQKMVWVGSGKTTENKDTSADAKTFFKTLRRSDDDAHANSLHEKLNAAARAATGKDLTEKDFEAFDEIVELIINETKIARTRTKSVSVYLKFAAENLRRRLYANQSNLKLKSKVFEPGSPDSKSIVENLESPEPLGAEREILLEHLQRIVGENGIEAIEIFRENYTNEDWQWVLENLQKKQNQ